MKLSIPSATAIERRESDGTMIDAKGPGLAWMLKAGGKPELSFYHELEDQAERQVSAAGSRDIEWYFAEPEAAELARKWFEANDRYSKIKIIVVPPELW
ncbi:hypothetical protein [Methylocystis heyeri]|uniref:Uncharacterized protein n=1 Tax=Methylocystis heyeri TaxID=391905 RepID=A0A6B8KGB9_9HYPH|nr:hypothetical protein [Methylocystis heyeri]QGM45470.1 hypothetical protein H2LOC_007050 [Methylocystis heyeri]